MLWARLSRRPQPPSLLPEPPNVGLPRTNHHPSHHHVRHPKDLHLPRHRHSLPRSLQLVNFPIRGKKGRVNPPKPRSKQAALAHDSDIETIFQEGTTEGKRRQGKRKASPLSLVNEGDEEVRASAAPVKRRKRNVDTERPQPKFKTRGGSKPSTTESTASTAIVDPEPEGSTSQKNGMVKKRKINLFQPSGKMDFANLDFGSQVRFWITIITLTRCLTDLPDLGKWYSFGAITFKTRTSCSCPFNQFSFVFETIMNVYE
ncbi:hypothetical protein GGU11DRAFT_781947 [Lentinula aff. detonsa]|nr:hypothetical protein GGU11DRAFT_781947 [Lentinula aff. detonsa]